jgi:hypothetical protein
MLGSPKCTRSPSLFALAFVLASSAQGASSPSVDAPAGMPPSECEIRLRAWCIRQEDSIITDIGKWSSADPDHTWLIHHRDRPDRNLVVFEPRGCRKGFADVVKPIRLTPGVVVGGQTWDEAVVRLKADGSCDLTLRVPASPNDPLEWPFSTGRVLLRACKDEACTPIEPTIADVTAPLRPR